MSLEAEIEKLGKELALCRLELADAHAAVEMARETIGLLRLEVESAREETAKVFAEQQRAIKFSRNRVKGLEEVCARLERDSHAPVDLRPVIKEEVAKAISGK